MRGYMIWRKDTGAVQMAIAINLLMLTAFLALGIYLGGLSRSTHDGMGYRGRTVRGNCLVTVAKPPTDESKA